MQQELAEAIARLDRLETENARLEQELVLVRAALTSAAAVYRTLKDHPDINNGAVAAALASAAAIYETLRSTASDGEPAPLHDGHGSSS